MDSFEYITLAIKISRDLESLLNLRRFSLCKFVSNADETTSAMIPEDRKTSSPPINETCNGAEQSSHVLGHKWDHVKDTLVVSRGMDRPLDKAMSSLLCLTLLV